LFIAQGFIGDNMSIITDPLEKLTTKWMWLENVLGSWSFQGIPPITEGANELAQLRARIAELEAEIEEYKALEAIIAIEEPLDDYFRGQPEVKR